MTDARVSTFDLLALPACCRSAFFDGFTYGRAEGLAEGHRRGYAACDDEITTLQREAARIVHALADAPARDVEADERRAERSRSWWARRRGESAAGMSTRAIAPVVGVSKDTVHRDLSPVSDETPAVDRDTGERRGEATS